MPRQSLLDYLDEFPRLGRSVAFTQKSGYRLVRTSYSEISELAAQCAREFTRCGVRPGDRVMLWGRNSAEWAAAFFGCILSRAIAVPMDEASSPEFAGRVATLTEAKLVLTERGKDLPGRQPAIVLGRLRTAVAAHNRGRYDSPPMHRGTVAQILFTSGATAEPKGVVITHGNILGNLEPLETAMRAYRKWERLVRPLRLVTVVPLSHVFGQFMALWVPPLLGAEVYFQDSLKPAEVIKAIHEERASVLVAVPRVLEALQGKLERELESAGRLGDFRHSLEAAAHQHFLRRMWRFRQVHGRFGWRFWALVSGGATLNPEVEQFWSRLGFAAIQGYGLTETTSLVTVNHPFRIGRGSIGKALAGQEVKVDGNGEILVRGENVAAGYWAGPSSRIEPVAGTGEGWFHTGDFGAVDHEGNLYFKGRKKNVIVTGAGMKIHPEDLEAALKGEPEVEDCVVVGLERGGNAEPCAVLLLREDRRAKQPRHAAGIVSHANESLAEYQRMRSWFLWPEPDFPRTATGKPKLTEIRAAVEAQVGHGNRGAAWPHTAGGIADLVARVRDGADSHAEKAPFDQLGSLDRVELMSAIEDRYQVDLNEAQFSQAKSLAEVEALIRGSTGVRSDFVFPLWPQRWPVTWIRWLAYYALAWPATHLMAHPRVLGRDNLRGTQGPILVLSNHVIYLDVGFVLAALPRRLRRRLAVAMGGERLQSMRRPSKELGFWRRSVQRMNYFLLTSLFNVFPLPKKAGFRESFWFAGDLVDRGWSILIFPEGDITPDGKLLPFRAGIGLLAANLNIPVVPIRIDGAYEIRRQGRFFNRPGRVRVHIGKAERFDAGTDPQRITDQLQQRVAELEQEPKQGASGSEQGDVAKAHTAGK